jgi:hypothetical protein
MTFSISVSLSAGREFDLKGVNALPSQREARLGGTCCMPVRE